MNTHLHPVFQSIIEAIPVPMTHGTITNTTELAKRIERQQDAMRCACDWLRAGASGRALEVLEANLK